MLDYDRVAVYGLAPEFFILEYTFPPVWPRDQAIGSRSVNIDFVPVGKIELLEVNSDPDGAGRPYYHELYTRPVRVEKNAPV
jgi:hypothetical protein